MGLDGTGRDGPDVEMGRRLRSGMLTNLLEDYEVGCDTRRARLENMGRFDSVRVEDVHRLEIL